MTFLSSFHFIKRPSFSVLLIENETLHLPIIHINWEENRMPLKLLKKNKQLNYIGWPDIKAPSRQTRRNNMFKSKVKYFSKRVRYNEKSKV